MKECPSCRACLEDTFETCPIDGSFLETAFSGTLVIDRKYRVESCLGRGGMGVVYRVRHVGLYRTFALKLIQTSHGDWESFVDRFRTEARALGRLKHPNIVEVTDYGVDSRGPGLPYLVMEYLEGTTLSELSREEGALPVRRVLPMLEAIAVAIDYVHGEGVLHGDLKTSNVIVTHDVNGVEGAKILDFGLAKLVPKGEAAGPGKEAEAALHSDPPESGDKSKLDEASTDDTLDSLPQAGLSAHSGPSLAGDALASLPINVQGTLAYLAPEVLRGEGTSVLADIYALGVMTYEILAGKLPFRGSPSEIVQGHLRSAPSAPSRANPLLSPELDSPIQAALAKDPQARPKSAMDFVTTLRVAAARAETRLWQAREIPRRLALALVATAVLFVLAWPLEHLGFVQELDRRTVDLRFAVTPLRQPDPRLLVVSVDEASLAADPTPLTERADEFGRRLEGVLAAGAQGVAMDFILPEQWSHSEQFSKLLLARGEILTLAALSMPSGETQGAACVNRLTAAALGPERFSRIFGFVNLGEDADTVARRANLSFQDAEGEFRDSWAAHAARSLAGRMPGPRMGSAPAGQFWIDFRMDWQNLPKISWKDLRSQLDRDPQIFRGKLVLVGAELVGSGDDYHRIPARRGRPDATSGVALQALIVNTILEGLPYRDPRPVPKWILLGLICSVILAASLCISRLSVPIVILAGFSLAYASIAIFLFRQMQFVVPVAGPLLTAIMALAVGLVLRSLLPGFPHSETASVAPSVKLRRSLSLGVLLLTTATATATRTPAVDAPEFVAVVTNLSGHASVLTPAGKKNAISLFSWLPAASIIETSAASALTLVFANGNRYEVSERTRLSLTRSGPNILTGSVRALDPLPPIPRLAAIANAAQAGARAGAIRLRGESGARIYNMYPRFDTKSLPDHTILRFDAVPGATRYVVKLEDESGHSVFDAATQLTAIAVPASVLRPGSRYRWEFCTVDRTGPPVQGEEEFSTLSEEDIRQRAALYAALQKQDDAASLALMADVDQRLGLWSEAREEFRAAIAKIHTDSSYRQALTEMDDRLAAAIGRR